MYSTREVLEILRRENAGVAVTEDQVRGVLRRSEIRPPVAFAGRLAWSDDDVVRLAACLGLEPPIALTTLSACSLADPNSFVRADSVLLP